MKVFSQNQKVQAAARFLFAGIFPFQFIKERLLHQPLPLREARNFTAALVQKTSCFQFRQRALHSGDGPLHVRLLGVAPLDDGGDTSAPVEIV